MKNLTELFASLFEAEELRRFIRWLPQGGEQLYRELPGRDASLNKQVFGAAEVLYRYGHVGDALFDSLIEARPQRRDDIERVRDLVIAELASTPRPRRDYLQYILEMERDRQPLTDIFTDLPGATRVSLEDVYIPPRLQIPRSLASVAERDEGEDILFEDWLMDVMDRYRETRPVVLIGEMGRGKTELMHRALHWFAERAQGNPHAPLPLLLRARDFAAAPPGVEGVCTAAGDAQSLVSVLFDSPSTRWIYLVDGLDEAPATVRDRLRSLLLLPDFRADLVIATSRPPEPLLGDAAAVLALAPWNDAHVTTFLNHWQGTDAPAVETLKRIRVAAPGIDELLRNPLTATLCLVVARRARSRPISRALLWAEMIEHLVEDWLSQRQIKATPQQIVPVLEDIALHHVANRQSAVERDSLMDALRPAAPEAARSLEKHVGRALGLLVERRDGNYEFLFRSLAEHLAGRALLRKGRDAVVAVAHESWAEEPVRHGIGYAAVENRGPDCRRMLSMLLGRSPRPSAGRAHSLRPLLIAIGAAADVGEMAAPLSRRFSIVVAGFLFEETSAWEGDRVAEAVQVLAGTGGTLMTRLWERCRSLLPIDANHEPVDWYISHPELPVEDYVQALRHRDANVRAVACQHLGQHVGLPKVREYLSLMCLDGGFSWLMPAMMAGIALRRAPRYPEFAQPLAWLRGLLSWRAQIPSGAAALGLYPDEANMHELAGALRGIAGFDDRLLMIPVQELAEASGGVAALDAEWPDWRERMERARLEEHTRLSVLQRKAEGMPRIPKPPASAHVRRRIARAFGPGFFHLKPHEVRSTPGISLQASIGETCRRAYDYPDEALDYLRLESSDALIPPDAQVDLGRAAERHTNIRNALLEAWNKNEHAQRLLGVYPGLALEPLVIRGDADATDIYAQWLGKISPHTFPFADFPSPDTAVFKIQSIKEAALARVRDAWRRSSRGYIEDGKKRWLAATTTGTLMHRLWAAWSDDESLLVGLQRWFCSRKPDHRVAAMHALSGGPIPLHLEDAVDELLLGQLERCLRGSRSSTRHYLRDWLNALAMRIPQAPHLHSRAQPLLIQLARQGGQMSPLAAAILLPLLPSEEEKGELSAAVAPVGITLGNYFCDVSHLRTLVEAAPASWLTAAREHLNSYSIPNPSVALRILPFLDPERQVELAHALHRAAGEWDLPWVQVTDASGRDYEGRPSDLAERVLFDAGVTL
jgi:hypothetical protein